MICRNCGTQAKGRYCSYCGMPLYEKERDGIDPPDEISPESPHTKKAEHAQVVHEERAEYKKRKRYKEKKRGPIRFFRILLPILMLFLPLAYLFFDIYVRLADVLFEVGASGETMLSALFGAVSSSEHAFLTVSEVKGLLLGSDMSLFQLVGARDVFVGGALGVAVWLVLVPTLLCAVMGVLLLISFGRCLRSRVFTDLLLFVAPAAGLSPLLGMLWLRLSALGGGFAAADAAAEHTYLSMEALLLVGIALCFMLPSVAALRRAAARARGACVHVTLPYRILGLRSFFLTRVLALASLACGALLALSMLFLPILKTGKLTELSAVKQSLITGIKELFSSLRAILSARGSEVDFSAMTDMLLDSIYLLQLPLMGLCVLALIPALLRVLFSGRRHLYEHPRACRSLHKNGKRLRNLLLTPYVSFLAAQVILVALWMFCSPLVMRVDFTNVSGMLELVYLTAGYVRTLCGTNTVYSLMALGGALIWHTFGALSQKLIQLSYQAKEN